MSEVERQPAYLIHPPCHPPCLGMWKPSASFSSICDRISTALQGMSQALSYFPLTQAHGHSLNLEINPAQGPGGTVFVLHGSNSVRSARKDSHSALTGSEKINCCLFSLSALRDCPLLVWDFQTAVLKKNLLIKPILDLILVNIGASGGREAPTSMVMSLPQSGTDSHRDGVGGLPCWNLHNVPGALSLSFSLSKDHPGKSVFLVLEPKSTD